MWPRCGRNHRTLCEAIKDCKGCKNNPKSNAKELEKRLDKN